MKKSWILVFDSGSGGRYTMEQIRAVLPQENYLLFMDKTNCPYGNKSKHRLKKIVTKNIEKLLKKFDIKLVVIACNTVSSIMDKYLQNKFYQIPFVFVNPQIDNYILNVPTLFLTTKNTAKYSRFLKSYKHNKNVYVFGFKTLAKMIDDCSKNYHLLQPYINNKLKKFKNKNIQNVVLGCTHFNHIKNQIQTALCTNVNFYENSKNIAVKTKQILQASNILSHKKTQGDLLLIYNIN